jgi:subtilisin-like proprotein convertase family protein
LIDEPADGTWTLSVRDSGTAGTGSLNGWALQVSGR